MDLDFIGVYIQSASTYLLPEIHLTKIQKSIREQVDIISIVALKSKYMRKAIIVH